MSVPQNIFRAAATQKVMKQRTESSPKNKLRDFMAGKRLAVLIIAIIVIVPIVLVYSFYPFPTSAENTIGKYNAYVTHWPDRTQFGYTDETGQHKLDYFEDDMQPGFNWIKTSTPADATFLSWWDYGHMIKAMGERNVVIRNPSPEILDSVGNPSSVGEFDPYEKIVDVAQAFSADNESQTVEIMVKYNATYLMVGKDDLVKSSWIFRIAGLNSADYVGKQGLTDLGKDTMLARLFDNRDTGPFSIVYQDQEMKIYKLI